MLSALLLFAAAVSLQSRVEKIPIQHTSLESIFEMFTPNGVLNPDLPEGIRSIVCDPTENCIFVSGTEASIAKLKELLVKLDAKQEKKVIPLKFRSAKYVFEMLTQTGRFCDPTSIGSFPNGFVPMGVKVALDPETNGIIAMGGNAVIRELELLLEQFDVKSSTVKLEVDGAVQKIDCTFSTVATVQNMSTWTYSSDSSDTKVSIQPRINGDRTITLFIRAGALDTEGTVAARIKSGEALFVRIHPGQRPNKETKQMEPVILGDHVSVTWPATFLLRYEDIPVTLKWRSSSDGPVTIARRESELRLLIKVTLPAQ